MVNCTTKEQTLGLEIKGVEFGCIKNASISERANNTAKKPFWVGTAVDCTGKLKSLVINIKHPDYVRIIDETTHADGDIKRTERRSMLREYIAGCMMRALDNRCRHIHVQNNMLERKGQIISGLKKKLALTDILLKAVEKYHDAVKKGKST